MVSSTAAVPSSLRLSMYGSPSRPCGPHVEALDDDPPHYRGISSRCEAALGEDRCRQGRLVAMYDDGPSAVAVSAPRLRCY